MSGVLALDIRRHASMSGRLSLPLVGEGGPLAVDEVMRRNLVLSASPISAASLQNLLNIGARLSLSGAAIAYCLQLSGAINSTL